MLLEFLFCYFSAYFHFSIIIYLEIFHTYSGILPPIIFFSNNYVSIPMIPPPPPCLILPCHSGYHTTYFPPLFVWLSQESVLRPTETFHTYSLPGQETYVILCERVMALHSCLLHRVELK